MTIGNYNNQQKIPNNQRYAIMMMTETDDTVQMRIIRMAKCRKIIIVHVDADRGDRAAWAEWNGVTGSRYGWKIHSPLVRRFSKYTFHSFIFHELDWNDNWSFALLVLIFRDAAIPNERQQITAHPISDIHSLFFQYRIWTFCRFLFLNIH